MSRVWRSSLVVLVLFMTLLFSVVPFTQSEEQNPNYTYRYGCPVWEPEEKKYCPERYQSLISAKNSYRKGEEVRITLTNLKDFEYNVEKVEVHFKPLFEHSFNLYYMEKDLGAIPRSKNEWTWTWDQRNSKGEPAGAGRAYVRITFQCCKNYRVYFRISQTGDTIEVPAQPETEEEVVEEEVEVRVQLPNPPNGLSTEIISSTEVRLTWTDNSNDEKGFRIYRNGSEIATVGENVTSFTDTDLGEGRNYTYRVSSYNAGGESSLSARQSVSIPFQVPAPPRELSSKALSPSKIKLTWTDNSDNEEGFRIYRNGSEIATVGENVTSFTDTGLDGNTNYSYQVASYNPGGESSLSDSLTITTPVQVPNSPGSLSSETLSPTEVKLTWKDNSDNEDGFRIYRNGEKIAELDPNTTTYTDSGLTGDTEYIYKVSSFNKAGESGLTSGLKTETPVDFPSSPEQLITEALSSSKVKLTWKDSSDNEDGFRIYRNGTRIAAVDSDTTSYVHRNLESGTRYCYEVVAFNSSGESEGTNRNCSMTLQSTPSVPGKLKATPLDPNSIKLTWIDNSDNEDGFIIYRNGKRIATVEPDTTNYIDTGLDDNTSYSYEITAYNDSGESGFASSGTVKTPKGEEKEVKKPTPEPIEEEPVIGQRELLAGIGIVVMVMGYIYSELD
ncbi:fibronectin type III domain-containing protein [Candidatus Bipolaricaulota bacterium]|nr:fibronectin type III domain-containing protein [Candidatus Bipolaricaulota bacterium]